MNEHFAHGAILLTESTPREVKSGLWVGQATLDMLANKEDFRFSFKTSSLVCPFCHAPLAGEVLNPPEKKKPWDIPVDFLWHETPNPECLGDKLAKLPQGQLIEKIVLCHIINQAAALQKEGEIHEDASIPKLHSSWSEEDVEVFKELLDTEVESTAPENKPNLELGFGDELDGENPEEKTQSEARQGKEENAAIPTGTVQRVLPYLAIKNKDGTWKDTLKAFPKWSTTNPEDENAPTVSGWITVTTPEGEKTLCGYVLPGDPEPAGLDEELLGYRFPIYAVIGPDAATKRPRGTPVPYLEVEILAWPPKEPLAWQEAVTVKALKSGEKARRREKIKADIDKLPKEKIWEGFSTVSETPLRTEADKPNEPTQHLHGYRPGGDVKKWWLPGIGNPNAKIWIIGLYPSNEEIKRKGGAKILSGNSGEELFELVRNCGLDPAKDVFFENLVKRYMPPKSKISAEIKLEQTWLLKRQLAHFKPERVICLGAEAFKEICGDKSFQDLRGNWIEVRYPRSGKEEHWTGRAAGTFHPAGVLRPEGRHNLENFRHDFRELLLDQEKIDVNPRIDDIKTIAEAEAWLERELKMLDSRKEDCIYTLDTEGLSLDPETDELLCVQVSRIFGRLNRANQQFEPTEPVEPQCDIFVVKENVEPEIYDAEVFPIPDTSSKNSQLDLFAEAKTEDSPKEVAPVVVKPPHIALANTEEERQQILKTHAEKRAGRGLIIFNPHQRISHIHPQEKKLGEIFTRLAKHRRCAGFAATNANYDRIRLEKYLGLDLSLPKENLGLAYPLDTMLAEHVLDENGDLGLKPTLNKHFKWPRQDIALDEYREKFSLDKIKGLITDPNRRSPWSLYPWSILRPYAGKDAYGAAALLAKQIEEINLQVLRFQRDRVIAKNPNTLEAAFYISCGAINGTYEMNKYGMPVGEKGMKILNELTDFYRGHEETMTREYQEAVYRLTGMSKANPASPEELSYVLFGENSMLRKQGIEPWKESGKNGRLWEQIPPEERPHCTPSTDAESLEIIAANCQIPEIQEFLIRLSETKTILTIRNSFLPDVGSTKGLRGRINPRTLHMHTTYTPTLDTNRCRSVPNLSTFPKEEVEMVKKILGEAPPYKIREIIQAPPGTWLLNRDWTTAEVLGLGYLAQDPNMLQIIARMSLGMDFHCKLAVKTYAKISEAFRRIAASKEIDREWIGANLPEKQAKGTIELWEMAWAGQEGWNKIQEMNKMPDATRALCYIDGRPLFPEEAIHTITKNLFKQERSNIKPVTFGVPYGREAKAIKEQLNREYYVSGTKDAEGKIVTINEEEAQAMIDSYKTEFSEGWNYLLAQAEQGKTKGYLRDHWGYIRHFPAGMSTGDLTRKAYNYQIQHIVAVLMNQAMNDWTQIRAERKLKSYAYSTLYDNIGWVVYEDELQEVWDLSMQVMTSDRPVGPKEGELPILNEWRIPTDGDLSQAWDGKSTKPKDLGIEPHPEMNLTGLEGRF